MEDKNKRDKGHEEPVNLAKDEGKDGKYGEIRYRLDQRSRIRNGIIQYSSMIVIIILTSVVTSMVVSRRMYEETITIDTDSNFSQIIKKNLESFEIDFYDRMMLRDIYVESTSSIVGVANSEEAFYSNSYDNVYSGVVMNTDGYILVPHNVVEDGNVKVFIRSTLDIDNIYEAEIIGKDLATDTAVIRVKGLTLRPPKFGDSSTVKVAQSVVAIGNPFGDRDTGTITFGVISTVNKIISTLTEDNREIKIYALETDAVVNKGTNGGVLVNMKGEVIGINSFNITKDFNGGFGAVITSNEARSIVRSIINTGEILVPYFGAEGHVIPDVLEGVSGLYISKIAPESTADRINLRPTDIILSIDGQPIITKTTLDDYVKTKKVGDVVKIRYKRSKADIEVDATLYGAIMD